MKIGILTHYYNSRNYGGNLQAFALVRFLKKMGYSAEQIAYQRGDDFLFADYVITRDSLYIMWTKRLINSVRKFNDNKRTRALRKFNRNMIPHSKKIYTVDTIDQSLQEYDLLITGSDQVWHPNAVCDAYLLNFQVKSSVRKISYAASFAVDNLATNIQEYYRECFLNMDAISVREKEGVGLVKQTTGKDATLVLDPTLLLPRKEWDSITEDCNISGKYIFCYFLGDEKKYRELAKAFAMKKQCIIVTLPFLSGKVPSDKGFGEKRLYKVSPGQLLSLIKNAEYIITDSYHVSVFSIIYEKEFYALDRYGMGSRIKTLTEMFHIEDHFCDSEDKSRLSYIESLDKINYQSLNRNDYNNMLEISESFLKSNIEFLYTNCLVSGE